MNKIDTYHVPIMVEEVLSLLQPQRGGIYVDGTLGGGGHSNAILANAPQSARLIGIDRDWEALETAGGRLAVYGERFCAVHGNFFDMKTLLQAKGIDQVAGILMDLGVSSHQLDATERGFSYNEEAPLDMRMDTKAAFSAYDVVNGYSQEELSRVIREYGEERFAGRVASRIVQKRQQAPIATTTELAEIIKAAIPAPTRRDGPHPARRTFQALRIEVNGELEGLEKAIRDAHDLLAPKGRMCIITFHSLEDRIVKNVFRSLERPCTCPPKAPVCTCGKKPTVTILTKKPCVAAEEELTENSRSRSAKLRAIEKL